MDVDNNEDLVSKCYISLFCLPIRGHPSFGDVTYIENTVEELYKRLPRGDDTPRHWTDYGYQVNETNPILPEWLVGCLTIKTPKPLKSSPFSNFLPSKLFLSRYDMPLNFISQPIRTLSCTIMSFPTHIKKDLPYMKLITGLVRESQNINLIFPLKNFYQFDALRRQSRNIHHEIPVIHERDIIKRFLKKDVCNTLVASFLKKQRQEEEKSRTTIATWPNDLERSSLITFVPLHLSNPSLLSKKDVESLANIKSIQEMSSNTQWIVTWLFKMILFGESIRKENVTFYNHIKVTSCIPPNGDIDSIYEMTCRIPVSVQKDMLFKIKEIQNHITPSSVFEGFRDIKILMSYTKEAGYYLDPFIVGWFLKKMTFDWFGSLCLYMSNYYDFFTTLNIFGIYGQDSIKEIFKRVKESNRESVGVKVLDLETFEERYASGNHVVEYEDHSIVSQYKRDKTLSEIVEAYSDIKRTNLSNTNEIFSQDKIVIGEKEDAFLGMDSEEKVKHIERLYEHHKLAMLFARNREEIDKTSSEIEISIHVSQDLKAIQKDEVAVLLTSFLLVKHVLCPPDESNSEENQEKTKEAESIKMDMDISQQQPTQIQDKLPETKEEEERDNDESEVLGRPNKRRKIVQEDDTVVATSVSDSNLNVTIPSSVPHKKATKSSKSSSSSTKRTRDKTASSGTPQKPTKS